MYVVSFYLCLFNMLYDLSQMNYNMMTHVNILSFQNTNQSIWNEVIYVYVKFIIPMFLEEETLEKYVPFRVET